MKYKLIATIAGLALATCASLPMTAQAQQSPPTLLEQHQALVETLNLTEQQQEAIATIRLETRSQLADLLTPQQKQTLQEGISQGQTIVEVLDALNLTPEQRSQARSVLQSSREQIGAVLTEDQRQLLRQELRERFARFNRNR